MKNSSVLDEPVADVTKYTGILCDTVRMISVVEEFPMLVNHTYPSKEIAMLRIAEEANFCGCSYSLVRSDDKRVHAFGRGGSLFEVRIGFSIRYGWKVHECKTRMTADAAEITAAPNETQRQELIEEGTADGDSDDDTTGTGKNDRSPFKTRWIVPLILKEVSDSPNISTKNLNIVLAHYIKPKFMSSTLVQKARLQARVEAFGNPNDNVQFVTALVEEMESRGHAVLLVKQNSTEVSKMLEKMVLQEEINKRKAASEMMTKQEKIMYLKEWKAANIQMLIDGGIHRETQAMIHAHNPPSFVSGLFFSTSAAKKAVPHLQQVFQCDAAHVNFGKYMIYSIYGTTAYGNTYCVGFGLHFGNETRDDWEQYFRFVRSVHPCLANSKNTIITDQAKGLIESIKLVLPEVGHFHCSFHRRQNILKVVKGGSQKNSCLWYYNECMKAKNVAQLENIKLYNAPNINDKGLKYLNTLPDTAQYPAARVAMGPGIYMYHRSASLSVESMNQANKPVREKSAVDIVNGIMLLLKLDSKRHQEHKDMAWKWLEVLTPHGKKLRDMEFAKVTNQRLHDITILETDDRWNCRVVRTNFNERKCWFLKEPVMGSVFGGCSCGGPLTDGIPCHHMIAVVKSSRIKGLNETNVMPHWWTTEMWRLQYPQDSTVPCDFNMNTLKDNHVPDTKWKYCPPYVAPTKAGRPKSKRLKSFLEGSKKCEDLAIGLGV